MLGWLSDFTAWATMNFVKASAYFGESRRSNSAASQQFALQIPHNFWKYVGRTDVSVPTEFLLMFPTATETDVPNMAHLAFVEEPGCLFYRDFARMSTTTKLTILQSLV